MPVARRATAVHRVATSIKIEAETHATVRCGLHAREVSARGAPRRQPRAALAPPPPRAQPVAAVGVSRRTVDRQKNSLGDRARVIKLCSDLHGLGARGLGPVDSPVLEFEGRQFPEIIYYLESPPLEVQLGLGTPGWRRPLAAAH